MNYLNRSHWKEEKEELKRAKLKLFTTVIAFGLLFGIIINTL